MTEDSSGGREGPPRVWYSPEYGLFYLANLDGSYVYLDGACNAPELAADAVELRPVSKPRHVYTSTACQHALHDQCRLRCKFCEVDCVCTCHAAAPDDTDLTPAEFRGRMREGIPVRIVTSREEYERAAAEQAAQLREEICRILHDANTGKICPDENDPTRYPEMADAVIKRLVPPSRSDTGPRTDQ